ncbi:MAG: coproporphyrinogen III oxidase, partial [Paenibacillus sp. RIFOXYA1_FULL_44_5]
QVEVVDEQESAADLTFFCRVYRESEGVVRAVLKADDGMKRFSIEDARAVEQQTAHGLRRAEKRAVLTALLLALQSITGIEQPWGTLTGIRPTKLMHQLKQQSARAQNIQRLQDDYLLSEEKAELLAEIVDRQLQVIPDLYELKQEVSIYIGIPFCPTKCAYCTFPAYDIRKEGKSVNHFLAGLHYEIEAVGRWLKAKNLGITSIYWGGGTPTSIAAEEMDSLFQTLYAHFPHMDRVRELTVEAGRPDTITSDKIKVMQKWKVDRISINPQSFTQQTLDTIGRDHTVTETLEKFALAREMGMKNINMDLIIGLPDEGMEEYKHSLEQTARLLPESLTVHTLSFKRASKMTRDREEYEVAETNEIREMIRLTGEWTKAHHYQPYYLYRQKNILGNQENVGYSLPGKESIYNILMMEEKQTIIGLGCGAVSKLIFSAEDKQDQSIERFPNPKDPSA